MKSIKKIYKPSSQKLGILFVSLTVLIVMLSMAGEITFTTVFLGVVALFTVVAIIDMLKSKVTVKESQIEITGLFNKEIIPVSEVKSSKIKDHKIWINLKNGETKDMPAWFDGHRSLHQILRNKLGKPKKP